MEQPRRGVTQAATPRPVSTPPSGGSAQLPCLQRPGTAALSLGLALSLFLALAATGLAAELPQFEVYPPWMRPGPQTVVRLHLANGIEVGGSLFLRLTKTDGPDKTASAVIDLPIASDQARRGLIEIKVASLARGQYQTELVAGNGLVIARGQGLRAGAAVAPEIESILPKVIYPTGRGYDLELLGDDTLARFKASELGLRINGVLMPVAKAITDRNGGLTAEACGGLWPCLIQNWRTLHVYGLALQGRHLHRPLTISVEADQLLSQPRPLTLSCVSRSVPIAISFLALALAAAGVVILSGPVARRITIQGRACTVTEFLLSDPRTKSYSLSKFQLLLWLAASVVAYSYLSACQFLVQWRWVLPEVPDGLPALLGLATTTAALSIGATGLKGSKGAGAIGPTFGDFITNGGVFAPERLQFFLWTLLGATGFVAATLSQDPATADSLAEIPQNFAPLMGASSLGYLAGKFARKPGPVLKAVRPAADGLVITGENLARVTRVEINGEKIPSGQISPSPDQPGDAEFVTELTVRIDKPPAPPEGKENLLKVANPDGQCAERAFSTALLTAAPQTEDGPPSV